MTAEDVRHYTDALAEYAAGAPTGPSRAAVEAHLAHCASCRAEVAGWTTVAPPSSGRCRHRRVRRGRSGPC
jgi:hypothetical protein